MALVDLILPKLGESIMEATILKWLKNPGDSIAQDEAILEIATDKVDSEVPATVAGVLKERLFNENDVVPIGTVIARIETHGEAAKASAPSAPVPQTTHSQAVIPTEAIPFAPAVPAVKPAPTVNGPRFYSPLVLKIAQEEGISMTELETIPGTGMEGRVSKKDILDYIQQRGSATTVAPQPGATHLPVSFGTPQTSAVSPTPSLPNVQTTSSGQFEIIEMDRMRKMIAKHMVDSKHTSAHVTSFTEADVTNMVLWRDKVKKEFEKRENTRITFTPIFIETVAKCLKKYPLLNSSLEGDRIIVKKDLHIGMATALPSGNLIVPVIKNADQLNLVGLARQVNGLAEAARNGKLKPDDTVGGTFTLTNVGSFGSLMGTPIINQPQVAILAVGAIKKRPVVIETDLGDSIAIRHMMYLSLSYDHRIIDGALGSTFLNAVARELEAFDINRAI